MQKNHLDEERLRFCVGKLLCPVIILKNDTYI